jgi:hypothetical protein
LFCDFGEEFVIYDTDGERVEDFTLSELFVDIDQTKTEIFIGTKDAVPYEDDNLLEITDVKF